METLELRHKIAEIKNLIDAFNNRLDRDEKRIN